MKVSVRLSNDQAPSAASIEPPAKEEAKPQTKRTLAGGLCVLRMGQRHIVLIRLNPVQCRHLGFELMFGVKLAKRFRAPLYVIRPDRVVNTALYELVVDDVMVRKHGAHHGFIGRGRISSSFARKYIAPQLNRSGVAGLTSELRVGAA